MSQIEQSKTQCKQRICDEIDSLFDIILAAFDHHQICDSVTGEVQPNPTNPNAELNDSRSVMQEFVKENLDRSSMHCADQSILLSVLEKRENFKQYLCNGVDKFVGYLVYQIKSVYVQKNPETSALNGNIS